MEYILKRLSYILRSSESQFSEFLNMLTLLVVGLVIVNPFTDLISECGVPYFIPIPELYQGLLLTAFSIVSLILIIYDFKKRAFLNLMATGIWVHITSVLYLSGVNTVVMVPFVMYILLSSWVYLRITGKLKNGKRYHE